MSKKMIFDNEYATMWFHPETKVVHHQLKRFVYGQQLHDVLNRGCELLKENKARKWLSDDRNNGPVTAEDTEWTLEDWTPRVVAAGWKFWAIVMPEKVLGKMNMKKHGEFYAAQGITVNFFSDPDEGLKWLESQK